MKGLIKMPRKSVKVFKDAAGTWFVSVEYSCGGRRFYILPQAINNIYLASIEAARISGVPREKIKYE